MIEAQAQLSEREFNQISQIVYKHCGINLHEGKRELVQARLAKRMRIKAIRNTADYIRYAMDDTEEFTHLIDAISTNLTSFFRESAHFTHLEKQFLPQLLERKKKSGQKTIRAWSAGCSTGEEPYTIGMTLLSTIPGAENWDIKILATDLSTDVLNRARQGVYEGQRANAIPPALRSRFVVHEDGRRTIRMSEELRSMIRFAHLNLMNPWPFTGPFDFIFCRNVMIYFDKPTQEKLVNRYWEVLSPGGLLFTGHSESLTGVNHRFGYVCPTIYLKH